MSTDKPLATIDPNRFVVNMPDEAPALGFDPMAPDFNWTMIYPSNYWNLDDLEGRINDLGGNPVYTPARISIEPVINPEDKEPNLAPEIVMYFEENCPALVFNKTRCNLATKITGTRNPHRWAELLGPIELYPGVARDFSMSQQILFRSLNGSAAPATNSSKLNGRATQNDDVPF